MFNFFHRTPEITLDCFTYLPVVYENTPIVKAAKAMPDWWTKLNAPSKSYIINESTNEFSNPANIKSCYGILELYKRGIILESWSDIIIKVKDKRLIVYVMNGPETEFHTRDTFGEAYIEYIHAKLASPWMFKENTGVKFLYMGAEWSLENFNFKVLPGVLNFQFNSTTHVNIMVPYYDTEYTIPFGQPLVHMIPLTEKKLNIKTHLVSLEEYKKHVLHTQTCIYGWRKIINIIDRNKARESKCPFT